MKRLLNVLSLGVICGGASVLAHPVRASATYINPWTSGGDYGVLYCCESTRTASCCYWNTGCATRASTCMQIPAAP